MMGVKYKKAGALFVAALLFLAGCGVIGGAEHESAEELQPITLKVYGYKTGAEIGAIPEIVKDFEEENPDIMVEYVSLPMASGYEELMNAKLASGEQIDIFMTQINTLEGLENRDHLMDLSEEVWISDISSQVRNDITIHNKIYALPLEMSAVGMYCNMQLLKQYKLDLPDNWYVFVGDCAILKDNGVVPVIMGNKNGYSGTLMLRVGEIYQAMSDENLADDLIRQKRTYASVLSDSLEKYDYLKENRYFNVEEANSMEQADGALAYFANGNGAFFLGGSWDLAKIHQFNEELELQFIPIPIVKEETDIRATLFLGAVFCINADTQYPEQSKRFLEYWSRPEVMERYIESQSAFSPLMSCSNAGTQELAAFQAYVDAGKVMPFDIPGIGIYGDWEVLNEAVSLLALGESVEDVKAHIDAKMKEVLP